MRKKRCREQYLGQFPAQAFDKMNENFIRCSLFELCSRYMSHAYTFALEQNLPSGRSDLEFTGVRGTSFLKDDRIVEFNYFKVGDEKRVMGLSAPYTADVEQVKGYAQDVLTKFPYYNVRTFVVYIVGNKGYRFWEV